MPVNDAVANIRQPAFTFVRWLLCRRVMHGQCVHHIVPDGTCECLPQLIACAISKFQPIGACGTAAGVNRARALYRAEEAS